MLVAEGREGGRGDKNKADAEKSRGMLKSLNAFGMSIISLKHRQFQAQRELVIQQLQPQHYYCHQNTTNNRSVKPGEHFGYHTHLQTFKRVMFNCKAWKGFRKSAHDKWSAESEDEQQ